MDHFHLLNWPLQLRVSSDHFYWVILTILGLNLFHFYVPHSTPNFPYPLGCEISWNGPRPVQGPHPTHLEEKCSIVFCVLWWYWRRAHTFSDPSGIACFICHISYFAHNIFQEKRSKVIPSYKRNVAMFSGGNYQALQLWFECYNISH